MILLKKVFNKHLLIGKLLTRISKLKKNCYNKARWLVKNDSNEI